ncbi:hypothetical protein SDC9_160676 [bioreactor metagenome]|uniref:Uncharacterized protein n=1 Tax=bioreactor metagenome TaxID=1076179 RepID=A0A645FG24_9ZZZZ
MSEFGRVLKASGCLIFSVHHPFMDFTTFRRENYFATELLQDEWETPLGTVPVQFYRRPLQQIIAAVIEGGFVIEMLLEPVPTAAFQKKHPHVYDSLTKKPHFLVIKAKNLK